jgi:hypothetical protein
MEILFVIILSLLATTLSFWALISIVRSRFKNPNHRTIWLIVVLFFPILGSIIYFQKRRDLITRQKRVFQPNFNSY